MDEITSIRCPTHRPHSNKYELCGKLLLAIHEGKIYVYCDVCKTFYEIIVLENDNVEMRPLPKDTRLKLVNKLKVIM